MIVDQNTFKTGVIFVSAADDHSRGSVHSRQTIRRTVMPNINGYMEQQFSSINPRKARETTVYHNLYGMSEDRFSERLCKDQLAIWPKEQSFKRILCRIDDAPYTPGYRFSSYDEITTKIPKYFFVRRFLSHSKLLHYFCLEEDFDQLVAAWEDVGLFNEFHWWFREEYSNLRDKIR